MRTKDEIERSKAEMKRIADDARRGLAKAKEMNATVLVKHFEQWKAKCEARAQILSWVLDEQELSEDVQPQLPQAHVSLSSPPSADVIEIFEWLLGYSDFPERRQGDGAFWWRKELRHRLEFLGINIGGDAS